MKYDTWQVVARVEILGVLSQPYLLKQLIPHWKHRKLTHRFDLSRKETKKYDTWASTTFTPYSVYYTVLQPYITKQFIRMWKLRLKFDHFIRGIRTTPKYDTWRSVIFVPPTHKGLTVNVPLGTLNIRVIKQYPMFIPSNMPK